jgi:adenylate cyclase
MAFQAEALTPARANGTSIGQRAAAWLSGLGVRQLRLACGLVMFSYIFSHFLNHALGNISFPAMAWWLKNVHVWWWRIPIVNATLYTAAVIHFSLGLWALYQRRHFRYTAAELTQLLLGLSIPLWLADHFAPVRLASFLYDTPPIPYQNVLLTYWVARPHMVAVQFILLTIAWVHACIGLYFWLRMKPAFRWAWPVLFAVAVLMPPLAMLGAHHGAQEVIALAKSAEWRKQNLALLISPPHRKIVDDIALFYFPIVYGAVFVLIFAARGLRVWRERRRGMVTVSYPDRQIRMPKGLSILEGSLRFRVPHASICGGRARCSTCRVRIVSDRTVLPPRSRREAFVLTRVGAANNPAIRLACQLRPQSDVALIPVIPPHIGVDFVRNRVRLNTGKERYVVSMFVDMRGSTRLAEARLPFDVVFLVNRFLGAASQAVVDCGGKPNQFVGDGVLALFGLESDPGTACRQALRAAAKVAANVEYMNHQFAADLQQPIEFGIGIHAGEVIVGDIGFKEHTVFTALGDSVNVAARLQDMTKTLECQAVVSDEVCTMAGVASDALSRTEVAIRGRAEPMSVRIAKDSTVLASLLESPSAVSGEEPEEDAPPLSA